MRNRFAFNKLDTNEHVVKLYSMVGGESLKTNVLNFDIFKKNPTKSRNESLQTIYVIYRKVTSDFA